MRALVLLLGILASPAVFAAHFTCSDTTRQGPWTRFEIELPELDRNGYFPDEKIEVIVTGNFKGNLAIENDSYVAEDPEIWHGNIPSWKLSITSHSETKIIGHSRILSDFGSFDMDIGLGEYKRLSILVDYNSDATDARSFYKCTKK